MMGRTEIDLFDIAHVKVEFIPVLKMYTIRILGRFVWSMHFVKCGMWYEFFPHLSCHFHLYIKATTKWDLHYYAKDFANEQSLVSYFRLIFLDNFWCKKQKTGKKSGLYFSTFYEKKVDFSPISCKKKNHSALEVDTFKVMLLRSIIYQRTWL